MRTSFLPSSSVVLTNVDDQSTMASNRQYELKRNGKKEEKNRENRMNPPPCPV